MLNSAPMEALKAKVVNGHYVIEDAATEPEGTELYLRVLPKNDDPELIRELEQSVAEAKAGKLIDGDAVMAELRARS